MKEENLDALLMFRQESMYWLTGYDTFGYVFFQTLILNKNFYVFTGSTVGVVPILGKGLYAGKIDKLGSVKAIIS